MFPFDFGKTSSTTSLVRNDQLPVDNRAECRPSGTRIVQQLSDCGSIAARLAQGRGRDRHAGAKPSREQRQTLRSEHAQYRACGCRFGRRHNLSDVCGAAGFNARMAMNGKGPFAGFARPPQTSIAGEMLGE
jgi:hypothetical protein